MNNKDKMLLASLQESMKEFVKADIGKAARADLRAIETANGGAKMLAEAGSILADAQAEKLRLTTAGSVNAAELLRAAEQKIDVEKAAFDARDLAARFARGEVDELRTSLNLQSKDLADLALALKTREYAADERDKALDVREAKAGSRDASLGLREALAKRFDEWRATSPDG